MVLIEGDKVERRARHDGRPSAGTALRKAGQWISVVATTAACVLTVLFEASRRGKNGDECARSPPVEELKQWADR